MTAKYLIMLCCLFGIVRCTIRQEQKLIVEYPLAEKTVSILSDSSYVSSVSSMFFRDAFIYVAENKRSQILVLDTNLMLINTISRSGRGPGELMDIGYFTVKGRDTVVVNDCGNNRLQLFYRNGEYIRSVPLENINMNMIQGFLYEERQLIGTALKDSAHICYELDSNGFWNIQKQFGKRYSFKSDTKDRIQNDRHLLRWGNHIISISDNQPEVAIYDQNYNLLLKYNYAQLNILAEQINFINDQSLSDNSYMVLVKSCSLWEDKLYLLINQFTPQYKSNMIVQFALDKLMVSVNPAQIYFLPDNYYSAFTVDNTHIYALGEQGFQLFHL